jgi:hypothetical protein
MNLFLSCSIHSIREAGDGPSKETEWGGGFTNGVEKKRDGRKISSGARERGGGGGSSGPGYERRMVTTTATDVGDDSDGR